MLLLRPEFGAVLKQPASRAQTIYSVRSKNLTTPATEPVYSFYSFITVL